MRQADVFCVALGGASERKRSMVHRVHMLPQAFNRTVQGSAHDAHGEAHGVDIAVQSVCMYCGLHVIYCTVRNSCIRDPAGRPINLFRISGGNKLMTACRSVVDRPTNMHPRRIETDPIIIVVWFGSWVATSSLQRNRVRGRHSQHRCTAHTAAQHCAPHYIDFNTDCCDEIVFYAALVT